MFILICGRIISSDKHYSKIIFRKSWLGSDAFDQINTFFEITLNFIKFSQLRRFDHD